MYATTARYLVESRQRDLYAEAASERLARKARRHGTARRVGLRAAARQLIASLFAAT